MISAKRASEILLFSIISVTACNRVWEDGVDNFDDNDESVYMMDTLQVSSVLRCCCLYGSPYRDCCEQLSR
ncbi:hypothetical protein H9L39_02453 [Fusarium oxysporum f. sp. albedinis]|nr:hypothetical protein H9L39_02453 [Fusarium oxysporum f. sp. albedinis]